MDVLIAFYVSGHGFGHAARDVILIQALATACPGVRVIVRTAAPAHLFAPAGTTVDVQACEADTGVIQRDSISVDVAATARRAAAFYADFDRRVDTEADFLARMGTDVVVGDIPPLAFAAAAQAGLPSVAVGNFTWDWIYNAEPEFAALAPGAVEVMCRAYARTTLALRLPFHGGFAPMAPVTEDIPWIARRSLRSREETRRRLAVPLDRPLALASFGAYGLALPWSALRRETRFTAISVGTPPSGLHYEDIIAAADVVVSKPGYGIVSDCLANDTALLYTSRGRFIEYDVFVEQMPRVLRCAYVSQEDLVDGRWAEAIEGLLAREAAPDRPRLDGAAVAAREILEVTRRRR